MAEEKKIEEMSSEELGLASIEQGNVIVQCQAQIVQAQGNLKAIHAELTKRKQDVQPED